MYLWVKCVSFLMNNKSIISNFKNKNINDISLWEKISEEGKLACCYISLAINGGSYPCISLESSGREGREGKGERRRLAFRLEGDTVCSDLLLS